jgi:N-acetyl-1-D-myo-inositol-2-amino-2-deoxy-alpha-D-glucopyranoside deacetylase
MSIRPRSITVTASAVAASLFTPIVLHSQTASTGGQMEGAVAHLAQGKRGGRPLTTAAAPRQCMLAVLAHPDDEIFIGGILADLAERGARVVLACATKGEAGKAHPSVGTVQDLGALRAEELRLSCKRLGIEEPVFLGFHDSGRNDRLRRDDPHALAIADMLEVEAAIRNVMEEVRPQVVLTFDAHGGYYHPDHVAIQRAATAAFFSSGVMGKEAPQRLFYEVMTRDRFREFAQRSKGRGFTDGLDPDVFGVDPTMIAMSFDARGYLDRKFLATAAHRSAFGLTEEMVKNPPPPVAAMLDAFLPAFEQEDFVLAGGRVAACSWPLHDLFEGLNVAVAKIAPRRNSR